MKRDGWSKSEIYMRKKREWEKEGERKTKRGRVEERGKVFLASITVSSLAD